MLAIVVPAYKPQFLQLALDSIAMQTNKSFKCYIFDDAAPEEIKSISYNFPDFHYARFEENMGGRDLVGHWHRCLESIEEEWVWLFSDDDIMGSNCVEEFYKTQSLYPNAAVFRFAVDTIDANGQVININKPIKNETGLEFLVSRLSGQNSYLQDHIFNWKKLREINGGFVKFPLAWCSDDATWCLLGKIHEIIAISSAIVQWRRSGINICSIEDMKTLKIKLYAYKLFYLWCSKNFNLSLAYKLKFVKFIVIYSKVPFLYFFQPPIFNSPVFILVILLVPIRKLYIKLKRYSLLRFRTNWQFKLMRKFQHLSILESKAELKLPLVIYYRISDAGYQKIKPSYINNENCLRNAVKHFPIEICKWVVVADNCSAETMPMIKKYIPEQCIHAVSVGHGAGTFRLTYQMALELNENTPVYFLENDYLHRSGSYEALLDGLSMPYSYVTLYDHPDKYDSAHFAVKYGGEKTRVLLGKHCHWKIAHSTTMTFASKVKILKQDWAIFDRWTRTKHPYDCQIFMDLARKNHRLISPLPSFSTHGETAYLAPLVQWEKYI